MLPPALRPSSTYKKIIYEDHVYLSSSTLPLTSKQANVYEEIKDKLLMYVEKNPQIDVVLSHTCPYKYLLTPTKEFPLSQVS